MCNKTVIGIVVGFKSKRKHSAEPVFHLLNCNIVIRVILKSRICNKAYTFDRFQITSNLEGIFVVLFHTQRKCYRTSHNQPCIERADCCAEINLRLRTDNVEVFFFADDCTSHCITVTVDVLCKAFNGKVCTEFNRSLVERRSKCVVNRQKCAVCMGKLCNLFNVGN